MAERDEIDLALDAFHEAVEGMGNTGDPDERAVAYSKAREGLWRLIVGPPAHPMSVIVHHVDFRGDHDADVRSILTVPSTITVAALSGRIHAFGPRARCEIVPVLNEAS